MSSLPEAISASFFGDGNGVGCDVVVGVGAGVGLGVGCGVSEGEEQWLRVEDIFRFPLRVIGASLERAAPGAYCACVEAPTEWTWPHDRGHMWDAVSPHPSYL